MTVILCIDDNSGMMFNSRRQSRDRAVRENIVKTRAGAALWMDAYSYGQFGDGPDAGIQVDEAFLEKAGPGELCFVEDRALAPFLDRIERIIIYKWNRKYPADVYLDVELPGGAWRLAETEELKGFSHERITKESYTR